MNTNAAAQASQQPAPEFNPRWSSADELLVWTVSRIDGGRRQGVEPDCHVVYGLSSGHFVEQTRKFRASAEQCIEMLQQGKRAGTTQRKIALDTIVAVRSDARTGRLQIRTLNGTHQLDPISYDEADVLRQIAIELELRMPPGGADFSPIDGAHDAQITRDAAAEERRSLASLENARAEDGPDNYQEAQYRTEPPAGAAETPGSQQTAAQLQTHVNPGHLTEDELERLAASLAVEAETVDAETVDHDPDLPADITVAGGVEITYDPVAGSDPAVAAPIDSADQATAGEAGSPRIATSSPAAASWVAAPDVVDDSPIYMSQQAGGPDESAVPDHVHHPVEEPVPVGEAVDSQNAAPEGDISQRFDRLQHRALRHQIETGSPLPGQVAEAHVEPVNPDHKPTPSSVFPAPASPLAEPFGEADTVGSRTMPIPQDSGAAQLPEQQVSFDAPTTERRHDEDPNFPSIFDRRGAGPARPATGHGRFGDDLPVDHSVSNHLAPHAEDAENGADEDDPKSDLPDSPPTLSAPSGPPVAGMGGSVGFNPDFDVNPFR